MDLEIKHLLLLKAIVEEGGMTKAAAALHLTQPALSHQLRDAESRLGVALFRRERRKLVLTAAGERLLETARRVCSELDAAESEVRGLVEGRCRIRLSTGCYTCYSWFGGVMDRYRESHPKVDLEVVAEATRNPLPWVADGRLDLAVVLDKISDRRIEYVPGFGDELVAVVPKTHPLAKKPFAQPADFAGEPLILYDAKLDELDFIRFFLRPARVRTGRIQHVQLTEAILDMVRAGLGITALADWAVAPRAPAMGLATVRLGRKGLSRTWFAAFRKGAAPHLRDFASAMQAAGPKAKKAA